MRVGDRVLLPCGYGVDVKAIHLPSNALVATKLQRLGSDSPLMPKDAVVVAEGEPLPIWLGDLAEAAENVDTPLVRVHLGPKARTYVLDVFTHGQHTAREVEVVDGRTYFAGKCFLLPPLHCPRSLLMLPAKLDADLECTVARLRGDHLVLRLPHVGPLDPHLVVHRSAVRGAHAAKPAEGLANQLRRSLELQHSWLERIRPHVPPGLYESLEAECAEGAGEGLSNL